KQDGECLPDLVVKAALADLIQKNRIGLPQDCELVPRDGARNADGEARAGKRMPSDESFGKPELAPQRAHFVLEEIAERFHELQMHPLRQATDIVMRLD